MIFHDDSKTKKELLENIIICKTEYKDVFEIIRILKETFNIPSNEHVIDQLLTSNANLKESVKIIDKRDNKIYGILIFSHFNIAKGTPIQFYDNDLCNKNKMLKQINGHSFVIDKRLRNTNIDKQMLSFNNEFIKQYKMIWCGVDNKLKSKNYWLKLGFKELFHDNFASFMIKKEKEMW